MSSEDKREMARRLRVEAEGIRRHGLTNFFEHTLRLLALRQVMKSPEEDRGGPCPPEFVHADYREEAFPCQHINEQGWTLAAEQSELAEQQV